MQKATSIAKKRLDGGAEEKKEKKSSGSNSGSSGSSSGSGAGSKDGAVFVLTEKNF